MIEQIEVVLDKHNLPDHEIERALGKIDSGVCIKSFPFTSTTMQLLELYQITHGGFSGTDLIMLPYPDRSVFDQPYVFFQASRIISEELSRGMQEEANKEQGNK